MADTRADALADSIVLHFRGFVGAKVRALADRIDGIEKRIREIPAGEKGEPGTPGIPGKDGEPGIPGPVGKDGRDGVDGAPGRDAIDIEIRDGVDVERSYPRGTFAAHDGGVMRAARTTDPLTAVDGDIVKAGWHVVWIGVKALFAERSEDGRKFTLQAEYTGSRKHRLAEWELPVLIYRGVFNRKGFGGEPYAQGDVVTFDGQLWHCEAKTMDAPPGPLWRLMVRRGQDADARKGQPADSGPVRLK